MINTVYRDKVVIVFMAIVWILTYALFPEFISYIDNFEFDTKSFVFRSVIHLNVFFGGIAAAYLWRITEEENKKLKKKLKEDDNKEQDPE